MSSTPSTPRTRRKAAECIALIGLGERVLEETPNVVGATAHSLGAGARLLAADGLGHTRIARDRHVVGSAVHFVTRRVRTHALALAA